MEPSRSEGGRRPGQGIEGPRPLIRRPNLDDDREAPTASPDAVRGQARAVRARAKRRVEAQKPAEQRDEILEGPLMRFAGGVLALIDERPQREGVANIVEQEAPKALAGRIKSGRAVEGARERQDLVERDAHWGRQDLFLARTTDA